jgi:hypothetical protein
MFLMKRYLKKKFLNTHGIGATYRKKNCHEKIIIHEMEIIINNINYNRINL